MSIKCKAVDLKSGGLLPQFGYGTYLIPPAATQAAVEQAITAGITHIDTAQMYGNESGVGAAVKASGIAREHFFITTKLNNGNHEPKVALASLQRSLEELQLDYVDLFLIHWPLPMHYGGNYALTWEAMLLMQQRGLAKSVGVSNFQIDHLEELANRVGVFPEVNQIESHPYFPNDELHEYHRKWGIVSEAWSPLARGKILADPVVLAQAQRLGCTPAQLVLAWSLARGDVVFPKTLSVERLQENLGALQLELDEPAITALASLNAGEAGRVGSHPDKMDRLDIIFT